MSTTPITSTLPNPFQQPNKLVKELFASLCQSCGMCCIAYFNKPFCVPVETEAGMNIPPKKLVQIGPRTKLGNQYMRKVEIDVPRWDGFGKCVALEIKTTPKSWKASCTIYENRPNCCVEFEPGSKMCQRWRTWAKLELPAGLMDLERS